MDTQVQELIEAIKADGVQTAEKQAEQIIAAAEEKAEHIVAEANKRSQQIISDAEKDRARQEAAGMEAVKQAGRDLILGVQSQLVAIFKTVVENQSADAYRAEVLERAISTVVENWAKDNDAPVSVILSESDRAQLESSLRAKLAEKLTAGAEIVPSSAVKSGFRLSTKNGEVYYDFTTDAVAEALAAYLTPRLAQALREAGQGA
ncbi:MAG: V-type ATP synthase subunit E [Spirochaetales bacterium]